MQQSQNIIKSNHFYFHPKSWKSIISLVLITELLKGEKQDKKQALEKIIFAFPVSNTVSSTWYVFGKNALNKYMVEGINLCFWACKFLDLQETVLV